MTPNAAPAAAPSSGYKRGCNKYEHAKSKRSRHPTAGWARDRAGREESVPETGVPSRVGLRDHGAGLRQGQPDPGGVPYGSEEFLEGDSPDGHAGRSWER